MYSVFFSIHKNILCRICSGTMAPSSVRSRYSKIILLKMYFLKIYILKSLLLRKYVFMLFKMSSKLYFNCDGDGEDNNSKQHV